MLSARTWLSATEWKPRCATSRPMTSGESCATVAWSHSSSEPRRCIARPSEVTFRSSALSLVDEAAGEAAGAAEVWRPSEARRRGSGELGGVAAC